MHRWNSMSAGMSSSLYTRSSTCACSVVGTEPIPSARAASIRFWTDGMTELAWPLPVLNASTMHGASLISSARRAAATDPRSSAGISSRLVHGRFSSRRLAHHASRYSPPNSRIRSGSVRTRKRPGWRLPPVGALAAASNSSSRSSAGIGSGRNRRIDRWENIASPMAIFSRAASAPIFALRCRHCRQHAGCHTRPARPETGLGQSEEFEHRGVEHRRLLQIDRVPTLRHDEQTCRWYVPLQEDRWLNTRFVLVADDQQRRDVQSAEGILERKDRRPPAHDAKHRQRLAGRRVLGKLAPKDRPAVRIFAPELHARRTHRVYLGEARDA